MKHYRRKKFFYKLFLRKSPRNAALFGVSLIALLFSIIPAMIFVLAPYVFMSETKILPLGTYLIGAVLGLAALWFYAITVTAFAYSTMTWKVFHKKYLSLLGVSLFFSILPQIGGILIIMINLKQKRWLFVLSGAISVICFGTLLASMINYLPFTIYPYSFWLLHIFLFITLLTAISGYSDKYKFNVIYLWPLLTLALYIGCLQIYKSRLKNEILRERKEIEKLLGHSIKVKDFWKSQKKGFQIDSEPLQALIATDDKNKFNIYPDDTLSESERRKTFLKWNKKHPDYINKLKLFLQLPVRKIGHKYTDKTLVSIAYKELKAFRNAARYLSYDMSVNCHNRDIVLQRNSELEKLRNWALGGYSILSKILAIAIENKRLWSLKYPLQAGSLTTEDWKKVLGNKPDWGKFLADAIGDETTLFQSVIDTLPTGNPFVQVFFPWESKTTLNFVPLEFSIHSNRDYRYSIGLLKEQIKLFLNPGHMTASERSKLAKINKQYLQRNYFLISAMLLPPTDKLIIRQANIIDYYRLVETAVKVMDYRKKHGKLPDSLKFLPEIPLDYLNRLPFEYEHGKIKILLIDKDGECFGFRIYTRDESGKDPGGIFAKNDFTVILKP